MSSTRRVSDLSANGGAGEEVHRAQRAELRARLAAERAELLCSLLGIEVEALEARPLLGEASAMDLLGTLAARENDLAAQIEESLETRRASTEQEPRVPGGSAGFEDALARCIGARLRFLDAFARAAEVDGGTATSDSTNPSTPFTMATQCYWNDSSLSMRAGAWTRQEGLGERIGSAALLRAAVRAARKELLTTIALVPAGARDVPAFEGGRTLLEIFRMVIRLERMFLDALTRAGFGAPAPERARAPRPEDEWQRTWADLHSTHAALLTVLDRLDVTAFAADITDGAGNGESIYMWARGCLLHDRLHAAHIRADLELDWPERLLR